MEITIHEGEEDQRVRSFLDGQWKMLDPAPWTGTDCVVTAERDGALIGVATCSMSAGVAHLGELMVVAGERNSGLGARLLATFEQWAAAHGAHKMTLDTRRDGDALRFYERHGWRVAYVMEDHYLRHAYALMVKVPETP